ncbi:MAG: PTS sugar transporter subunit IIA [Chlamydiia bacterium]|nr:PTS sugar transporter subunit IIA [Chlamydiia bacterium]
MKYINEYLSKKQIVFLNTDTRDEALEALIDALDNAGKLEDRERFLTAILEREKIVSTGIGMGVAIPHAKLPEYRSFFIAIGIHPKGMTWGSLDGVPVRLVFMIGGPDDQQTQYLQLLSRLTMAIKDEERRKKILQSHSEEAIISLFEGV